MRKKRLFTRVSVVLTTAALCALIAPAFAKGKADAKKKKKKEYINAYEELAMANKYAAAGAISRSIPHYLKALKADPVNYSVAHYNLAEVYKAKRKCNKAGFHYQAYILTGRDADTKKAAAQGVKTCGGDKWPSISVSAKPTSATVKINGYPFSQNGQVKAIKLPKGSYQIDVDALDHTSQSKTVNLTDTEALTFELNKLTFYGELGFSVMHKGKPVVGATISVTPKKIDKAGLKVDAMSLTTPVKKLYKLPTGKYFIEIKADGYDRWIRNVYITRDSENKVGISLSKSLPEEIR